MGNNDPRHDLVGKKGRGLRAASGPSTDPDDPRHRRSANVFLDDKFVGFGLKIDSEGRLSVDLDEIAEYEPERVDILSVPFHMDAGAALTDTDQPLAEQLFRNGARHIVRAPLGTYRQARLVVHMGVVAAVAGATITLEYSVEYTNTRTGLLQVGVTPVSVLTDVTNTVQDSGWIDLATLAKADVHLGLVTAGGNGVIDPQFGNILAYFRR